MAQNPNPAPRADAKRMQAEQTAREAAADGAARARPAGVAKAAAGAVAGQRLIRAVGPGNLYPGAKLACIKAGEAVYCGSMAGLAYSVREHPNAKDATKTSYCFAGDFIHVNHDGTVTRSLEAYLPSVVEKAFAGMLKSGASQQVRFALAIWAEPDEVGGRTTAQGFQYVAYDVAPARATDPLLSFAAEAGLIEAPRLAIAQAPEAPAAGGYDPETGEVNDPA